MGILQGSTYELPIYITDIRDNVVTDENVISKTFTIGTITKTDEDISFDKETNCWIVKLNEDETFSLNAGSIEWQARFKFVGGKIDGTGAVFDNVRKSINKVRLTGEEENA